ncbi:bi-domain-containing oxidoreductase [Aliarcobacter butzleri]|uniref:bi-domain-containing oxidoreductase n=1 Tax=Aliarcobacter butzleri TaxID=28197 RepID=UPI0021B2B2F9|nr:bi-domain-containing oxidoreductase [Aliarcobacter butzleri]MCT7653107.1 bi-domain-containing oxidoreductase [Aliarcobacter butzleri]
MKQLIQSYKTGELGLFDVPAPICEENGVLIQTTASLVSAGTEKQMVDLAKKSLLGKAKARPDLVKQVLNKMKQDGIQTTLEKVFSKLDTPVPLGYSCTGKVLEIGNNVSGVSLGDRVACGGAGYANHSEVNFIPKNLFVKIPSGVDDIDASFVTVGSIAMQGVRQANLTLGEKVAVIGLGLIGQITVQLLKAHGCQVIGADIDLDKIALAKKLGANETCHSSELLSKANEFSNGNGVDAVIITASASSNQLVYDAGEISRKKGRVVIVGLVGMDIPRDSYYKKELDLRMSMSYGPGRYDSEYEEKGHDYPYHYVRWTEQRNFESFLDLVAEGKVTPKELITHTFDFDNAMNAYDLLEGKIQEKYLGIVLEYKNQIQLSNNKKINLSNKPIKLDTINIGLIGAGNFTKDVLLPNINKVSGLNLVGLCTATGISGNATGKKHNFKFITTDENEIYNSSEINTLIVTTRHNDHYNKVIKGLENNKNIFIEKPLCLNETELEFIKEKFVSSSSILQVGFNRRFSPLIVKAKNELNAQPMSVFYRVNGGIIPKDVWIQDSEIGGGRIVGEVCHFIDTCSFLIGSNVKTVYASMVKKADRSIPDEDNISINLVYENGSTATIIYVAYGNKQMAKEYIEIFANNIAITMDNYKELHIMKGSSKSKDKSINQDKGFVGEFEAFKYAIKSGKMAIDFESIHNTTMTTFKILESLKAGKVVEL